MRRLRLGALLAAGALFLPACSMLKPAAPGAPLSTQEQVQWLQRLERFELHGRIAGAVGTEGFNAQLDLQQRGEHSRLVLRSPLGFGSATVETDGHGLQYRSSRGEQLSGEAGLQALTARLGFEPPLRSLRYWIVGVPDPASPSVEEVAVDGGPRNFRQNGWRVTIAETGTAPVAAGTAQVPRRVTLERAPVRLRIVVDRWKPG